MRDELFDLYGRKDIFWELQDIAKENPKILRNGSFFDWMCRNYISAQVVAIRRFADQSRDSHSLWRLLYELLERPKSITRAGHARLYSGIHNGPILANLTFDAVVGRGKRSLSSTAIRSDIRSLERATDRIRRFVNKKVAHFTSPTAIRKLPSLNELDAALEAIDKLFHKYDLLLTGRGSGSSESTRQYDWREVLWEPWVLPGSPLRPVAQRGVYRSGET